MIRNSGASTNNVSIELTKLTAEKNISEVFKSHLRLMQGRFIICHLLPHCMLIILKSILCGPYQKDIPPIGYVYVCKIEMEYNHFCIEILLRTRL